MTTGTKEHQIQPRLSGPLTALGALVLVLLPTAGVASAESRAAHSTWYQATFTPLNHSHASGWLTLELSGSKATIHEEVEGLAGTHRGSPYPHLQEIRIGGAGSCPTTKADVNGDGVVDTTEGVASYGDIGATLSVKGGVSPTDGHDVTIAPSGAGYGYDRTLTLDATTMAQVKAGEAVVVVHGLDPATLSKAAQGERSDLVPSLTLAATSPALCGVLSLAQLGAIPTGPAETGVGTSTGTHATAWRTAGAGSLALAACALLVWRRLIPRR